MAKRVHPMVQKRYVELRKQGWNRRDACREAGCSESWAKRFDYGLKNESSEEWVKARQGVEDRGPIPLKDLEGDAAAALEDYDLFRRRYFGHVPTPWQTEAALEVVRLLGTPDKEYAVINAPPGSGKSTNFTHDLPCWVTVRRRSIRGVMGAFGFRIAEKYTRRIKRSLERRTPVKAADDLKAAGLAVDAEATLMGDFGRFKPEDSDIWQAGEFVVAQHGDVTVAEKESTWSAFGRESGQLGVRMDFIVWDDLVTQKVTRSQDVQEDVQEWFDSEAENRLEPGGLLLLQGQRMGTSDLYAYCLKKSAVIYDEDEDPDLVGGAAEGRKKYHHIRYPAHWEDRCVGDHKPKVAKAYPEGCLLDPVRVPWRELRQHQSDGHKYRVLWQQEDADPLNVLAPMLWIDGGVGSDGEVYPGCWDNDRPVLQAPANLTPPVLSICSADPSPTMYWSVQWWLVQPETGLWWLMDHLRQRMDAPSFLEWNNASQTFSGVMEEWQDRSVAMGYPISAWVVEDNAAQRYLLQHEYVRRWMARWETRVLSHTTHKNKADPEFGVWALLRPMFRHGRVRLPGGPGPGRLSAVRLVDEVTRWPEGRYDDCVMAMWMAAHRLPTLLGADVKHMPRLRRPKFLRPERAAA